MLMMRRWLMILQGITVPLLTLTIGGVNICVSSFSTLPPPPRPPFLLVDNGGGSRRLRPTTATTTTTASGTNHGALTFQPKTLLKAKVTAIETETDTTECDTSNLNGENGPSISSMPSLPTTTTTRSKSKPKVWYSHPDIGRDRTSMLNDDETLLRRCGCTCTTGEEDHHDNNETNDEQQQRVRYVLSMPEGMWSSKTTTTTTTTMTTTDTDTDTTTTTTTTTTSSLPLYLTPTEISNILEINNNITLQDLVLTLYSSSSSSSLSSSDQEQQQQTQQQSLPLLIWIGSHNDIDYWAVHLWNDYDYHSDDYDLATNDNNNNKNESSSSSSSTQSTTSMQIQCQPVREFGDTLESSFHAGIVGTANGLIEFHKSNQFCSMSGQQTKPAKVGSCRVCTNPDGRSRSIYPRIDVATIMLITSPCTNYALLGRKHNWPRGRYSTLAGFCEVGETLEECCIRETFEESGVMVDPQSMECIASQPWPFPRSLMVGYHAQAMFPSTMEKKTKDDDNNIEDSLLPPIVIDTNEMEDIQWFSKDVVRNALKLEGSTALLTHEPTQEESTLHFPGRSSLARVLISNWADNDDNDNDG